VILLFRAYVPIREEDLFSALDVAKNTSFYLLEQAKENLSDFYKNNKDFLLKLFNYLNELKLRRVHFAARGRSLYQGARTLAERLMQLGYNSIYPNLEQFIVYDPSAHLVKGDVLIAISTSGETKTVVKKAKFARDVGGDVIAFTGNPNSTLSRLATLPPLIVKPKINQEQLIEKYNPKPFTPLGTTSEFTTLILMESISTGLKEMLYNNREDVGALKKAIATSKALLDNAQKNLETVFSNECENLADFLSNLLLKYYSQQTVHFCARGKTFNMAVGPFKMRLDQIPNAFVTSILDYEPLNRPVRKGQITIVVSGSGMAYSIAKRAKLNGSMIISFTSYENILWEISDVRIKVPGRRKIEITNEHDADWDIRQWRGWTTEFAPRGTTFEVTMAALLDGAFAGLASYIGITENQMKYGHANIE